MDNLKDSPQLSEFFCTEQQEIAQIEAPADFSEKIMAAAADATPQQPSAFNQLLGRLSGLFGYNNRRNAIFGAIAAAAVIIVAVVVFSNGSLPEGFSGIVEIKSASAAGYEINNDDGLIITSTEALPENVVREYLQISPEIEYDLVKKDGGLTYEVIPEKKLDASEVYNVSFDPERQSQGLPVRASNTWAFQTAADFAIANIIPYDKSIFVSLTGAIQITFSSPFDLESAKKAISIKPAAEFEWQQANNVLTLIPQQNLEPASVYTLTIAAGITNKDATNKISEDQVVRFETASSDDQGFYSKNRFYIEGSGNAYRPSDQIVFNYFSNYYGEGNIASFDAQTYAFDSAEDYAAALTNDENASWRTFNTANYNLDKLEKLNSYEIVPTASNNGYDYLYHMTLPENLDAGYYLVKFSTQNGSVQIPFQVTELSAYASVGNTDCLFWVHDLRDSSPVKGAKVTEYSNGDSGKTNGTGVAIIDNKSSDNPIRAFIVTKGDDSLVVNGYSNYSAEESKYQQTYFGYWSYLYADRALYRPGDTVNYFGILTPRNNSNKAIKEATLVLNGGNLYGESTIKQTVTVNKGVISGELKLPQLTPGWYEIDIMVDDVYMESASFEVAYYDKSSYAIDVTSEEPAIMAGKDIVWDINASYFEDTPVSGLDITCNSGNKTNKLTTDDQGNATLKRSTTVTPDTLISYQYIDLSATLPELGDTYNYAYTMVFNRNVDFDINVDRDSKDYQLSIKPYTVDIGAVKDWYGDLPEQYRTKFEGNITLDARLARCEYDKVEETYYDEYTKQTSTYHYYNLREETEDTFQINLVGNKTVKLNKMFDSENEYKLYLTGTDSAGRQFEIIEYINGKSPYGSLDSYQYLYLENQDDDNYYADGETVNLTLTSDDGPVKVSDLGETLFVRSQEQIIDYETSDSSDYSFEFKDKFLPNINTNGVYFDGHYYYASYDSQALYDPTSKELQLDITPDKDQYAPGDKVKLNLRLKDSEGNPVKGVININLVDEALLAISEQNVDFVGTLFGRYYYSQYSNIISHKNMTADEAGGAEGGGEGDGARQDFRDTAYFQTLETDSNGEASVEFSLPDNITSWRVIWHGYISDDYDVAAGSGSTNINATQPFFVESRFASTYSVGDKPNLGLRTAGDAAMQMSNMINYTVTIKETGYSVDAEGVPGAWKDIELPKLKAGNYTLKITAKGGNYKDAITQKFTVVNSFSKYTASKQYNLKKGLDMEGSDRYMTTLVFSDSDKSLALQGLYNLAFQDNIRVEQRLASLIATDILVKQFDMDYLGLDDDQKQQQEEAILRYQQQNGGGIGILPYADADPEVSALAASFGKRYFDTGSLTAYFNSIIDNGATGKDRATALWGLAALGQPVLDQINTMLAEEDTSAESQIALVLGLYYAGDGSNAKVLAKEIVDLYSEDLGGSFRAKIGSNDAVATTKATAKLALLANIYELPQADGLYQYVLDNQKDSDYFLLEQLGILQSRIESLGKDASFSYTLNGETVKVDLSDSLYYYLSIKPADLKDIKFSNIKGDVSVTSLYQQDGTPKNGSVATDQISISRSYNGSTDSQVTLAQDQKVTITITASFNSSAPEGYYTVEEFLPAGLRFSNIVYDDSYDDHLWLVNEDGQHLTFAVYKDDSARSVKVTYQARVAMTGSYTAAAPYISHSKNSNILISGDKIAITIE